MDSYFNTNQHNANQMDDKCVAIKADGLKCSAKASIQATHRCRTHHKIIEKNGPNMTELKELAYKQKKERDEVTSNFVERLGQLERSADGRIIDEFGSRRLNELYSEQLGELRRKHRNERTTMVARHNEEIRRNGGVDPDALAMQQRQRNEQARAEHVQRLIEDMRQRVIGALNRERHQVDDLNRFVDPERNLRDFANDNQNVHTTDAVKQTKDIVKKIREIHVPEDYRWNMTRTSKTIGEIIAECKLTPHAACQMLTQYSSTTSIYDIEQGIYGKVLDSVWQFVKNHKDKDCLCAILNTELQDNVGMCAQGNLSRICNIVAGFMDGVGSQESMSEKLGRLLPPLMDIEDPYERIEKAYTLLKENNVPLEEWDTWAGPLIDDEVEDTIDLNNLRTMIMAN